MIPVPDKVMILKVTHLQEAESKELRRFALKLSRYCNYHIKQSVQGDKYFSNNVKGIYSIILKKLSSVYFFKFQEINKLRRLKLAL